MKQESLEKYKNKNITIEYYNKTTATTLKGTVEDIQEQGITIEHPQGLDLIAYNTIKSVRKGNGRPRTPATTQKEKKKIREVLVVCKKCSKAEYIKTWAKKQVRRKCDNCGQVAFLVIKDD